MSSVLYLYEDRAVLEADFPDCERCEKLLGLAPEDDEWYTLKNGEFVEVVE